VSCVFPVVPLEPPRPCGASELGVFAVALARPRGLEGRAIAAAAAAADGAAAGAAVLRLRAVGRLVRSKHVATADGGVCRGNAVVGERGAEHGDRRDEQREQQRPAELERGGGQRGVRQVLAPPAGSVSGRERLRANRSPLALLGSFPPQEPPTQVT